MIRRLAILLTVGLFCTLACAQTIESLRETIKRAEESIRKNTTLLEQTKQDRKTSESQLKLVQQRIQSRKDIITSLDKQIEIINADIQTSQVSVDMMNHNLDSLRKDYASMIYAAYKNYKLNNYLTFVFAAKDFDDITKRVNYMKRYNKMRQQKAEQISVMSHELTIHISDMDTKLTQLSSVKASRTKEVEAMFEDEQQYKRMLNKLQIEEKTLSKDIRTNQNRIQNAQKQIQKIIAEESEKQRKTPKTVAEKKEIIEISGKFDQNAGKLPYPVSGGVIIDRYGVHPHPTQKGITTDNKGVNIAAGAGADVKAVFEGTVVRIFSFQGFNNCIMIRHGNYITVYSNLASVMVKTGDKVALNKVIGKIPQSNDRDEHFIHFEIWKETENLNPENWLRR